jgi:hypothetical protein
LYIRFENARRLTLPAQVDIATAYPHQPTQKPRPQLTESTRVLHSASLGKAREVFLKNGRRQLTLGNTFHSFLVELEGFSGLSG